MLLEHVKKLCDNLTRPYYLLNLILFPLRILQLNRLQHRRALLLNELFKLVTYGLQMVWLLLIQLV